MPIELTRTHFSASSQNIPEVKLRNFYLANNPLGENGVSYVARPTLASYITLEGSRIRGFYYQQGKFNDQFLAVIDNDLYTITDTGVKTFIGNVEGVGVCRFASTIFHTAILTDNRIYLYDGSILTEISTPDDLPPTDVTSLLNYFIFSFQGSNKFYWIEPGETVLDGLNFASAESNPDYIVSVQSTSDELWLIGTTTTEVWGPTVDPNSPFVRITGRIFNLGCADVTSVSAGIKDSLPCIVWVSDAKEVILAQGSPAKISNEYVEESLRESSVYYGWFFRRNRNDYYVLTTDVVTLVYDLSFQQWYRWSTFNSETWDASYGLQRNDEVFAVPLLGGPKVWKLGDARVDETDDWLVCEVTGVVDNFTKEPIMCNTVTVNTNSGYSSAYGTQPLVEIRWSDDQGASWSNYMQGSLGDRGSTDYLVSFRSLGKITRPGRWFEFRFSGNDVFRLDSVSLNED